MDLVLGGDDHGVEEPTLGSIIQGTSQRDRGTEVYRLNLKTNAPNLAANQLGIVSGVGGVRTERH